MHGSVLNNSNGWYRFKVYFSSIVNNLCIIARLYFMQLCIIFLQSLRLGYKAHWVPAEPLKYIPCEIFSWAADDLLWSATFEVGPPMSVCVSGLYENFDSDIGQWILYIRAYLFSCRDKLYYMLPQTCWQLYYGKVMVCVSCGRGCVLHPLIVCEAEYCCTLSSWN